MSLKNKNIHKKGKIIKTSTKLKTIYSTQKIFFLKMLLSSKNVYKQNKRLLYCLHLFLKER